MALRCVCGRRPVVQYMQRGLHWSKVFTGRLSEEVKLVGSTISCETAYMGGKPGNEARHNAHVQSYVMATDQVLRALFADLLRTLR